MSHSFTVLSVSAVVGLLLVACGARGPLEDVQVVDVLVTPDGAPANTTSGTGSTSDGGGNSSSSEDAGGPGTGPGSGSSSGGTGFPGIPGLSDDGGIVSCLTCVGSQCTSQIEACVTDTSCASSLQCIVTTCLAGGTGGGGVSCFTNCAGTSGLTSLLPILECVGGACGGSCGSVIGGLGVGG
jgi:hypothetical protein